MFQILQVVAVTLVAVAMGLALAHALELPGKLRLSKDAYVAMQPIYYPGFTIGGGIGEGGGIIATLVLLLLTPFGTAAFWLTLVGLLSLLAMQGAYWVLTHPVNKFWLRGEELKALGSSFFSFDPLKGTRVQAETRPADWTVLRDRWEYSHVVRAGLAFVSLISLVTAIVL